MKIFISSDMEGTAGVVDWSQCTPSEAEYPHYVELLTAEINAAIEGASAAGATSFVVNDAHSSMLNLRPDALAGRAALVSGRHKPMYMMEGLDDSFDAVFLVSYHGSMGSESSVLSHTYFPQAVTEVTINGVVAGEAGLNTLATTAFGVPILLVTGDQVTETETRAFCPEVEAAVVKRSISRFAAESLHPDAARELIRAKAQTAIERQSSRTEPLGSAVSSPAELAIRFRTSDYAQLAGRVAGVEPTGPTSVVLVHDDLLELYQRFVTVVLLCRGLGE